MTKVADRAYFNTADAGFHAPEKIGVTQSRTPEGFLLCESVPIARTGMMIYGAGEIGFSEDDEALTPGADGLIRVIRDEDEVFHPNTIASFQGKPITDDHPYDNVTPDNWKDVAKGEMHNVRRGEGIYSDCLVADLLIKDADAIQAVLDGKREVSCGYDANYQQSEPGRARQLNIIGNHLALVDRGRCGPRCAIGDKAMATRDKKLSFVDRMLAKLKGTTTDSMTKDQISKLIADAAKEDEDDKDEKSTKDSIAALKATVDGIPALIATAIKDALSKDGDDDMTTDGDDDDEDDGDDDDTGGKGGKKSATYEDSAEGRAAKSRDEARAANRDAAMIDTRTMRDVLQTVRAHAEILAPGTKINAPTTDAKMQRSKFADSMCNCKRKALDVAYRTEAGRAAIEPFLNGQTADFASMKAKMIDTIFTGAAVIMGQRNNDSAGKGLRANVTRDDFGRPPLTNDALNKQHQDFWNKNGGAVAAK